MDAHTSPYPLPDRLWTQNDVAGYLSVSLRTLARLRKQPGFPPPLQLSGSLLRWQPSAVIAWAQAQQPKRERPFNALG